MSRFLIIDSDKLNGWQQYDQNGRLDLLMNAILTDSESLAKFKEVWDNGFDIACHSHEMSANPQDYRKSDWEEYSKTL